MNMNIINKSQLSESEIEQNYNEFIKFIESFYKGDRKDKLLKLYSEDHFGLKICTAPASPFLHFHLAQVGGYIIHITNVIKASFGAKKLYQTMGGTIDFTDEEMVFSAMHHDLGKLGMPPSDGGEDYYLFNDSDWHIKNRGEVYKLNDKLQYMDVTDRALYILQQYEIKTTWKEILGIKLADGMYNEAAAKYLKVMHKGQVLKTSLPYVIHTADYISCKSEYDTWKREND